MRLLRRNGSKFVLEIDLLYFRSKPSHLTQITRILFYENSELDILKVSAMESAVRIIDAWPSNFKSILYTY